MEKHPRLSGTSAVISGLELSLHMGSVVIVDADAVVLKRPATRDVLGVLLHSGLIGPLRCVRERYNARRSGRSGKPPSHGYLAGVHAEDFRRLMRELAADLKSDANAVMVDLIGMHVRSGDFVVLVTDAPQAVADALAGEFGVQRGVGFEVADSGGILTGQLAMSHGVSGSRLENVVRALGPGAVDGAKVYGSAGGLDRRR